MRAASSRICFTIPNNQPSDHSKHINQSTGDRPGDDHSANGNPYPLPFEQSDASPASATHPKQRPFRTGFKSDIVDGYTRLVTDRIHDGWSCQLVTILFSQLSGPRIAVINRMKDEVQRVYSTLVTRVHRKPRTAPTNELPILVGALDLPVYKRDRSSAPKVSCNGGLHIHVLILMPPNSRLDGSLADHFKAKQDLYAGPGKSVQRIHVRAVVGDHGRVVDYVLKTVLNGRLSYDEAMLVLPRTRREVETVSVNDRAHGATKLSLPSMA
jgi:hypothetical protein